MSARPAPERLRKRRDFLAAASAQRKWAAPGLILQVRRRPPAEPGSPGAVPNDAPRVGFTVTRKVGGAVVRNRVRRRLRAAAAEVLCEAAMPGHDYVLIGRGATVKRPYAALVDDLRTAVARLRMRRQSGPTTETVKSE
ncbi:MAG: ribonuclease P protein component [Rhodospirillales bacterium]